MLIDEVDGAYSPSVSRTLVREEHPLTILVGHTTLGTIASRLVSYTIICGLRYAPALSSAIAPGDIEILGHRQRNPI